MNNNNNNMYSNNQNQRGRMPMEGGKVYNNFDMQGQQPQGLMFGQPGQGQRMMPSQQQQQDFQGVSIISF